MIRHPLHTILLVAARFVLSVQIHAFSASASPSDLSQAHELSRFAVSMVEATDRVRIHETVTDGFVHPGIGPTKADLENVRAMVWAKKEPWYSYYREMTASPSAAKDVASSNRGKSDPAEPDDDAFDDQGMQGRLKRDAIKAYTQALMYVIAGDETYRANAMRIIRIWAKMNPQKYAYYTDAHIHSGYPLNRLVAAAEILRYTEAKSPEWAWTDADTENLTANLINPAIHTFQNDNSRFMNQNNFSIVGAMAGFIFTNNREGYEQRVEWFTVNRTARDPGYNGSIQRLFRLVEENAATGEKLAHPVVQLVEMGRDQAHGGDDMQNASVIARMMLAQGTKVDPVDGTVSAKPDAVGPYEFLDDRILAGADLFCRYMLGYETPWVPVPYAMDLDGTVRGIYHRISDSYRGRLRSMLFWDIHSYYTYVRGLDLAQKAPYFHQAFLQRNPMISNFQGYRFNAWEEYDGAGDSFWLFIPPEAESEGDRFVPKAQEPDIMEVEERFTAFDKHSSTRQENGVSFIRIEAADAGSSLALLNVSYPDRTKPCLAAFKFRSDGQAVLEMRRDRESEPYRVLVLPDTDGAWRYIAYDMHVDQVSYGRLDKDYCLAFLRVAGSGVHVDLDHLRMHAEAVLTPPRFKAGGADVEIVAFPGAPVRIDLAAVAEGATNAIAYRATGLPVGAALDAATGAFAWQPAQAGIWSFVVAASDGVSVATRKVDVLVVADRSSAVQAVCALYDPDEAYVKASLERFLKVCDAALKRMDSVDDTTFCEGLADLQAAVDGLEPLTPRLPDGSMDLGRIVVGSTVGDSLALLLDGNNNTYPVFRLAEDRAYTFDFGEGFQISVTDIAMQGRMNFVDRMAGSAAFGSNDGRNWERLTPKETKMVPGLSHIAVSPKLQDERFRYLKIQKIDPQPDALGGRTNDLFEPSELRVYGQRYASGKL